LPCFIVPIQSFTQAEITEIYEQQVSKEGRKKMKDIEEEFLKVGDRCQDFTVT
jgi:hypothetical protein